MKNLLDSLLLYAHFLHLVINFIKPFGPSGFSPTIYNRIMVSYDPIQNHVAIISKSISSNSQSADMLHFLYINYGVNNPYTYSNIILPYKAIDVRSNHNNLFDYNIVNCPPSERRFLLLSENKFVVMLFNHVSFMKNITTSADIVDYCMQPRREQFYTLQVNSTIGSQYTIGYYSPFLNCSRTVTIPEWYKPNEKPSMKCHNDVLILNFTDKVRVYSLNQSLWNIKTIKNHGNLSYMHTFGNVINVNNNSHILMFDKNLNFSLVKAIPKDPAFNYFFSLYYGNFTYLYITRKPLGSNFTFLAQYDLTIDMIIHQINTSMRGVHLQTIHMKIFLYEKTNGIVSNAVAYSLDNNCYVKNSSCPSNYFLTSANICTNPSLDPNFGGGYSGVSNLFTIKCCLQYFLVEKYNIYNQNNNFDGCCINDIKNEERGNTSEQSGLFRISNSSILNHSSYAISKVITITESGRLFPQVFQYFAMLVDDFELYGYHNYSYPLILIFFIDKASIMNEVAIGEQFTSSIVIAESESKQFLNLLLPYNWTCAKKLESIYFLHAAKELYFQDTIAVVVNYFSVKLLHLLLYILSKRSTLLIRFYDRLRNSSRWWIIICGLLETNMSSTTFFCFLQFMIPSYFRFANKLNLVFVVVELFCLLQYCLVFYQIVFTVEKQKYAENLISRAKYSNNGFSMQSIIFVCKNFCRGLICGLFINSYSYVIRLYVLTDVLFVLVLIKNYQQFKKKTGRNFTLFYLLCLTTLDTYFLLEKDFMKLLLQAEIDRQIFVLCLVFMIVVLAMALIFGDLTDLAFKSAAKCFNALKTRSKQSNQNKNAIFDLAQVLKNKNATKRNKQIEGKQGCIQKQQQSNISEAKTRSNIQINEIYISFKKQRFVIYQTDKNQIQKIISTDFKSTIAL